MASIGPLASNTPKAPGAFSNGMARLLKRKDIEALENTSLVMAGLAPIEGANSPLCIGLGASCVNGSPFCNISVVVLCCGAGTI